MVKLDKLRGDVAVIKDACMESQAKEQAIKKYLGAKGAHINFLNVENELSDTQEPSFMRALNINF